MDHAGDRRSFVGSDRATGEYRDCSPEERRQAILAAGRPPFVADLLVGLDQCFRESVLGETTLTVEGLTGAPPRPLTAWLAENKSVFTG